MDHRTTADLQAGLDAIRLAPADRGVLELIVSRPAPGERAVLSDAALNLDDGLVGDGWRNLGSRHTVDGSADVARQVTIMNARAIDLVAGVRARWPLAGDQLYVDLDVSAQNLPAGTRLQIGDALVEVSPAPHTGCAKFAQRFGQEAARFMNSAEGTELRLRGINARVIRAGAIRTGDVVVRCAPEA